MDDEQIASRSTRGNNKKNKKKSHKVRNTILSILLLLILAVAGLFGYAYMQTKGAVDKAYVAPNIKKARDVSGVLKKGKPISILLLGTDTGELNRNYKGRTDSMMVLTINPKTNKTTIMSIPRDTLIAIDGYEDTFPQKINSAYSYGSAATTIKTVQKWLNVPIDYYALVNMGGMEKVVDKIGGVKVTSPLTFNFDPSTANATGSDLYNFTKGSSTYSHNGETRSKMDGKAALAFSRMRHSDPEGDYGRQTRQRLVLQGIIEAAKDNPTKLLDSGFLNSVSSSTQTDLAYNDMITIVRKYAKAAGNISNDNIQGDSYSLSSGSTEVVSSDEKQRATNVLRKSLGLKSAKTGPLYGGNVSVSEMNSLGVPTE